MTETAYAARTNHAFVLTETVTVAELMHQGATEDDIRYFAKFQTSFYTDPIDAVYKALAVD